jgi:hypothetical protein
MGFFSYFALVLEETKAENWRDARVVEEARLESVYTPKVYRGFESRSLRLNTMRILLTTKIKTNKRIINLKN